MKVVLNKCYGGFGLSKEAFEFMGIPWDGYGYAEVDRDDPKLVECVETLGSEKASGNLSNLAVVEIPDGISWDIDDYDGIESISERHRSWY
jgi:hypothetical protein